MQRVPNLVFLALAFGLIFGVVALPRPWSDLLGFLVMVALVAFVIVQERATGRQAGVVKWFSLGLALYYLYRLVTFLT